MDRGHLYLEAYYGKLPEFTKLEKYADALITRVRKDQYRSNPNLWEENKKIEKTFAKIFGLKKMILYWIPADASPDAYTITLYDFMMFGESKDYLKKTDKGYYDTSGKSVFTVFCSTGFLSEEIGLTPSEFVACILHEFGHNFDFSKYHMITFMNDAIIYGSDMINTVKANDSIEFMNDEKELYVNDLKKETNKEFSHPTKRKNKAKEYYKELESWLNSFSFIRMARHLVYVLTTPVHIIFSIPTQFKLLEGKKAELFADSFSTAYGYGPDLMRGLEKLSTDHVKMKNTAPLNVLRDLERCADEIYFSLKDEHGTHLERCKNAIITLEKDIKKKDYPPELEESLYNELNNLKQQYYEMTHFSEDEKYKVTKLWRKINSALFRAAPGIAKFFKTNRV
jgi:hypothetical protein